MLQPNLRPKFLTSAISTNLNWFLGLRRGLPSPSPTRLIEEWSLVVRISTLSGYGNILAIAVHTPQEVLSSYIGSTRTWFWTWTWPMTMLTIFLPKSFKPTIIKIISQQGEAHVVLRKTPQMQRRGLFWGQNQGSARGGGSPVAWIQFMSNN